ncbi:MAG: orotidine-5'-phosphate decarboxylase [Saprospiraceae bacterium]|nr:orotidine-5'-phosphate decarboxylase [Saprospiraceae bacterium]
MTREFLHEQILEKQSFLCVGLDTDPARIPSHLLATEDPLFEFNKVIIDSTSDLAVAYKPNIAFYEALGPVGMKSLKKTIDYIPDNIMVIADAKRGDIGNTSKLYAKSFFEYYKADAITVAPYMGSDSVQPFLAYEGKWVIILGLTSNKGSQDFQHLKLENGKDLYEQILKTCSAYGTEDQIMFVVGATQASYFSDIRKIIPDHFLLVPGVGAQGGSLEDVCKYGMNAKVGLLVNSSRGIIYAGNGKGFGEDARQAALGIQQVMQTFL